MTKERISERKQLRRSGLANRGPQYIPKEFLDLENYVYRWINVSNRAPYKLDERIQMGYQQIPVSEFEKVAEALKITGFSNSSNQGSFISKPVGDGVTAYLMRIPKELKAEYDAEKEEMIKETEQMMKSKAQATRPGYGGLDFGNQ